MEAVHVPATLRSMDPANCSDGARRGRELMDSGPIVYVIAKAPQPRTCKTRLSPPLTSRQAVGLARAFLLDAVEIVQRAGIDVRVMCRSLGERNLLRGLMGANADVSVQ